MSAIAAAVRELIALGVEGEALVAAIERMELAVEEARAKVDGMSLRQARNAKYYEKRKRLKASESVLNSDAAEPSENVLKRLKASENKTSIARVENNPLRLVDTGYSSEANASSLAGPVAKTRPPPRLKSRRVPEDYQPSAKACQVAETEGFTAGEMERELAKFKDWEFAKPHVDWDAAFRVWIRNAAERRPSREHASKQADNLDAAWRGAEIAARFRAERSRY